MKEGDSNEQDRRPGRLSMGASEFHIIMLCRDDLNRQKLIQGSNLLHERIRKMRTRKFLALLLVLAMVLSVFCVSAFAATAVSVSKTSRDITDSTGTTIGSVSVSGMSTTGISDASWIDEDEATIIVDLIPATTPATGTLAVTITPTGGTAETENITVSSGAGSTTIVADGVTYTVEVQSTEDAYPSANTGNNYVGIVTGEGVTIGSFSGDGSSSSPYAATVTGPASGYPFTISLRIIPEVALFNTLTSYSYTVLDNSGAGLENFVGTYYLAKYTANGAVLRFSVTANSTTKYYAITLSATTGNSGSGIVSYLPAPGQFTNEGIATGGWGEIHTSGSANLKALRGAYTATGVSLGAFGGSIVFDFEEDGISDSDKNPFGVDFIVYGNAFSTNAEPGCIQVAPDTDNDGKPDKWYDIAGSLYYSGETVNMYYSDPTPTDNTNTENTLAAVPYSSSVSITGNTQTWSNTASITTNTFHKHSWFPLARNYFDGVDRTATKYTGTGVSGDMANVSKLTPETGSNPISVMEGQSIVGGLSSTTVISYSGRKIPWKGAGAGNYTFGYADVHANGSSYGAAVNPYAATQTTTGGDGIDIAWAVNPDGTPAGLTKIRFVRVYTGVQQVTAFGEVSTEVCGVYIAEPSSGSVETTTAPSAVSFATIDPVWGDSTAVNPAPSIPSNGGTYSYVNTIATAATNVGATSVGVSVTAVSGAYVYVNDTLLSATGTSGTETVYTGLISAPTSTQDIRIIVQAGSAAPYLFLYN